MITIFIDNTWVINLLGCLHRTASTVVMLMKVAMMMMMVMMMLTTKETR